MQIYSSPVLGLDLTHSAGSREGGEGQGREGRGVVCQRGSNQAAAYWKLILAPLLFFFRKPLSFTCHINSCPAVPVSATGINLTWFRCQCANTSTWLHCEIDLLYHFGCVNECHTQAIKWSFSQLYQDSIAVISQIILVRLTAWGRVKGYYCMWLHYHSTAAQMCLWWWQMRLRWRHLTDECVLCTGAWCEN